MLFKILEYALRRRALNAGGTAKSWTHKYIFNGEWESCPRIPFNEQNILLEVAVQFWKRDCTTLTKIWKYQISLIGET